jgi:transposase-like protein
VKVNRTWCYLYRALDRAGNLVDCLRSEQRDLDATKRFLTQAVATVGHAPDHVTTDGHDAYPRAIRETLGLTSCIAATGISIPIWSKTTVESSSGIIRCGGSAIPWQRHGFVRPSMRSASTSGSVERGSSVCHR